MIDFIKRHRISITFAVLLLVALQVLSSGLRGRRAETTSWPLKILYEAAYPFQKGTDWIVDGVLYIWTSYFALVDLRSENRRLREIVREMTFERNRFQEELEANKRLRRLLEFKEQAPLTKLPAQVIGGDAATWFRSITIDRGTTDGVRVGMVVMAPKGLVGHIQDASPHTSQILLVIDHNSAVSALVQRTRSRGIVVGKKPDRCQIRYLERAEEVVAGDVVITSGLGGRYPKGLLIGHVTKITKREHGLFQQAEMKPSVDLDKLEEVLILLDEPPGPAGPEEATSPESSQPAAAPPKDEESGEEIP